MKDFNSCFQQYRVIQEEGLYVIYIAKPGRIASV